MGRASTSAGSALRFFFTLMLDRPDLAPAAHRRAPTAPAAGRAERRGGRTFAPGGAGSEEMKASGVWPPFRGSACSMRLRWWQLIGDGRPSPAGAIFRPGLVSSTATDKRRQAAPERDHETQLRVSAQAADPRRACRHDPALGNPYRAGPMAATGAGACNTVVVALADQLARIAWAVLRSGAQLRRSRGCRCSP